MDYLYEQLDPQNFQYLCQALLAAEYAGLQFFPANQRDGGRDAAARPRVAGGPFGVFQVKHTGTPSKVDDPVTWLVNTVDRELDKIKALADAGASEYVLLTNVGGTAALDAGTMDRMDAELRSRVPMRAMCYWRHDLNARLDGNISIRWRYPQLLTGIDVIGMLAAGALDQDSGRRRRSIRAFLRSQFEKDRHVRFKEVELSESLASLFIDVPSVLNLPGTPPRMRRGGSHAAPGDASATERAVDALDTHPDWMIEGRHLSDNGGQSVALLSRQTGKQVGTAAFLLDDTAVRAAPFVVLDGGPGQGKSTLTQYMCQIHRARLLGETLDLGQATAAPLRLPIRVDLRDLADFLAETPGTSANSRSVESFLAMLIGSEAGGTSFSVDDFLALSEESELLLVFDGLDEVADLDLRRRVVVEIVAAVRKLSSQRPCQTVITTRPAIYGPVAGLDGADFVSLTLCPLSQYLVLDYARRWSDAKRLTDDAKGDVEHLVRTKLNEPHMRELARNPMQLAILLSLIHTRSASLPDQRTALYTAYVDLFLAREASKSDVVRKHRDRLIEVHGYLAWHLHTRSERSPSGGRIGAAELLEEVRSYLAVNGRDPAIADVLFNGMVERVVALVSRVEGTYEFEVQPLREYFTARYLYATAPYSPVGTSHRGTRPLRFDCIARSRYWLNVTRFFAGFYDVGELPSLAQRLRLLTEDDQLGGTLYVRSLGILLLQDLVFSQDVRSTQEVVDLCFDDVFFATLDARPSFPERVIRPDLELSDPPARDRLLAIIRRRSDSAGDSRTVLALMKAARANLSDADCTAWWHQRMFSCSKPQVRRWWLDAGVAVGLGVLAETDWASLAAEWRNPECPDQHLPAFANALVRSRAAAADSPPLLDMALASVLDTPMGAWFGGQPMTTDPVIHRLARAISARLASIRLGQAALEMASHSGEPMLADARAFLQALQDPAVAWDAWFTSLAPWHAAVELGRERFGERSATTFLGIAAGDIRAASERGKGFQELLDSSVPLTHRARHARLRVGDGSWWSRHLMAASTPTERVLVGSAMIRWARPDVLVANLALLNGLLEGVQRSDVMQMTAFLEAGRFGLYRYEPREDWISPANLPKSLPLATSVLLFSRCTFGGQSTLIRVRRGLDEGPYAPLLGSRRSTAAMRNAAASECWDEFIKVARDAHKRGHAPGWWQPHGLILPTHVIEQVLGEPHKFPDQLVGAAQESAMLQLERGAARIGQVARRDRWFARA